MCNVYKDSDLRKRYNKKRKQTLDNRNVGWELSFEEYKTLLTKSDKCDYTGEEFSLTDVANFKSIERIDKTLPYVKDNCCMVLNHVNYLKDVIEEGHEESLKIKDLGYIQKIKNTLENNTRLQLAGKYFPELLNKNLTQEETTMSKEINLEENHLMETHLDLSIANSYIDRCKNIQGFNISFNKYKQKYLKKTCDITGRTFNQGQQPTKKVFIKIDENKAWQDDNVRVVCNIVKTIIEHKLFTEKELSKLVKEL